MFGHKFRKEDGLFVVILVLFVILFISLFELQIVEGEHYKSFAKKNMTRLVKKPSPRGIIYDTYLNPLVENVPSLGVYVDLRKVQNQEKLASFLSAKLNLKEKSILDILRKHRFIRFAPILIAYDVDMKTAIELEENIENYPSIIIKCESKRNYLSQSHFLGYVGKISQEEYKRKKRKGYDNLDYIGKYGLEKYYEEYLKGTKGYDVLQVDAAGTAMGSPNKEHSKKPISGKDVVLTINKNLQKEVKNILPNDSSCVAIVINVKTGGILASVSYPNYDPNQFVVKIENDYWQRIINNPKKPLLNRICDATYPPGSVFKLVTAAYALESDLVDKEEILVDCEGGVEYGGRFFGCWKEEGHGEMNMKDAIIQSCDSYFYKIAEKIKLDSFYTYVKDNHLLDPAGIDLLSKRKGFFPTVDWYNDHYSEHGWSRGNILNLVIGQGEVLLTPLSIVTYYAGLANNGLVKVPHYLKYIDDNGKKTEKNFGSYKLPISEDNIEFFLDALDKAVNGKNATGIMARLDGVKVGGKTGSAENYKGDTHSWFTAIAPIDNPRVASVVFVENGGSGGGIAARLTGKILAAYFQTQTIY